MGKSKRRPLSYISESPGPGRYSEIEYMSNGPKAIMRGKAKVKTDCSVPGPGRYNIQLETIMERPATAVIGKDLRGNNFNGMREAPGPGTYLKSMDMKVEGPSFSFGRGRPKTANYEGPGPGAYHIPCEFAALPNYALPVKSKYQYI